MSGKTRRGHSEGSIHKRKADGLWCGVLDLGRVNGKRKRLSVYGSTRKEAGEKLDALKRARGNGQVLVANKQNLADYLGRWIEGEKANVRGSTLRRYEIIVRRQVVPHLGHVQLGKLQPTDVSAMYAALLAAGLAARTVGHAHRVLGRALGDAERAGLISRNVIRLVRPPRVPHKEMEAFDGEQARALVGAAMGDRLGTLYHVAVDSGARQGELLALRWRDVDFDRGTISIARTVVRSTVGLEFAEPKTAAGRRTILLDPTTMAALKAHRLAQAEERLRNGLGRAGDADLVFASEAGTPIDTSNLLANSYYPLLKRARLPRLTFHALRHTAATQMVSAGVPIRDVAARLGHADPAVTLRVYAHVTLAGQQQAAAVMGRVLAG